MQRKHDSRLEVSQGREELHGSLVEAQLQFEDWEAGCVVRGEEGDVVSHSGAEERAQLRGGGGGRRRGKGRVEGKEGMKEEGEREGKCEGM